MLRRFGEDPRIACRQSPFSRAIADIAQNCPSDPFRIDVRGRGLFARDAQQLAPYGNLGRDARLGVLRRAGIEDRVADLAA